MNQNTIDLYTKYLEKSGYTYPTIRSYVRILTQFPDLWDSLNDADLFEHINIALEHREKYAPSSAIKTVSPALCHYFYIKTGCTYKAYRKSHKYEQSVYNELLTQFYRYSTEFKHISESSAMSELTHVHEFLVATKVKPSKIQELSAHEIKMYVSSRLSRLNPASAGRYITSIRNFFRFLEYKGFDIHESIFKIPLASANWAKSKVPSTLSSDEEKRLRTHYGLNNSTSIRNRIIIILMLDFGLRCAEVSNINLSDVHWLEERIIINNTKNGHQRDIPISDELGSLLEKYVIHGRIENTYNALFLRKSVGDKYIPMTKDSIRGVVRRALKDEQITNWWYGTHTLRRTAASKLYNSNNGIKMTADILGHESLDSTKQYIRIDYNQLALVAACWPGGGSND